jgi:hypothetical protein
MAHLPHQRHARGCLGNVYAPDAKTAIKEAIESSRSAAAAMIGSTAVPVPT